MQTAGLDDTHLANQAFEAPFGAVAGAVAGNVALDKIQFTQEFLDDGIKLFLAMRPAFLALRHIGAIVAAVFLDPAPAHLPDAVDDTIQEVTIMADNEQSAGPEPKRAFQPFNRLDIQVVGRLVQDQEIGLFQKQTGQQGACLLTAA